MSDSEKELEARLLEFGENLLHPTQFSTIWTLYQFLDKLFNCLSDVEQCPPSSTQDALSPLIKAFVSAELFKHSDFDVKVYVAACICQIMRITAPDAPYDDPKMKEVFQLILSSFERLSDMYSYSYAKGIEILDTVAKFKVSLVMFDLGCDALLIEMFQHLLKVIRDNHPKEVFLCMENIMTLVLEESVDILPELLSPILDYVKHDDKIPQASRRLAEQVLTRCACELKTCLTKAVKASGISLDKYSNVVASICEGTFSGLKQNEFVAHQNEDKICKSRVSTGVAQTAPNDTLVDTDFTKKQDDINAKDEPQQLRNSINSELDKKIDEKTGVEHKSKKNGKQPSSVKHVESSKDSLGSRDLSSKTSAEGLREESRPMKAAKQKKKEISAKKIKPSAITSATKVTSEEIYTTGAKLTKKPGKVASSSRPQKKKAKTSNGQSPNKQSKMDIPPEMLSPIPSYVRNDDEVPQLSRKSAEQVLSCCGSQLKTHQMEAVKLSRVSIDKPSNVVDSVCVGAFDAVKQEKDVANEKEDCRGPREVAVKQDNQKPAEVSTPEQTCVHAASSSINKNGHETVSPRCETVAGGKTREKETHEMVQLQMTEEEDPVEAETPTHKRARVESCSRLNETHAEMETAGAEGEHSCRTQKASAEPEHKKLPQPRSVSDQLAKFRSEIKQKENNLEGSLQEVDVLGEKIMEINKILNS